MMELPSSGWLFLLLLLDSCFFSSSRTIGVAVDFVAFLTFLSTLQKNIVDDSLELIQYCQKITKIRNFPSCYFYSLDNY
jgi:hypothetical protein